MRAVTTIGLDIAKSIRVALYLTREARLGRRMIIIPIA
jgi:hypothetical protein